MLNTIKTYFDIDHYALANYVGVSKSQIDAVAVGRRFLETDPILAFHQLEKALQEAIAIENLSGAQHYVAEEPKALEGLIKKKHAKLRRKQTALAKVQQHRHRALRGLHACQALLQLGTLNKHQTKWVQLRERHLRLRLQHNPIHTVVHLQSEIAGLETQIHFLQNA